MVAWLRAVSRACVGFPATLAGCAWGDVGLPPVEAPIAVQAVLDAGSPRQVIWIEWSAAPGEPLTGPRRPLAVPPSRIEVQQVGGPVHSFRPDPPDSTRFIADFTPAPGGHYELVIEAEGRTIRGATVVPDPVVIVEPAADTVDLPAADLLLTWRPGSSRDFAWYAWPSDSSALPSYYYPIPKWVGSDTAAIVNVSVQFWWKPETVFWVMALDAVSARLYDWRFAEDPFTGNLDGAIGVFGALTWDRVYVRVPP